jgi:hypothetical protein
MGSSFTLHIPSKQDASDSNSPALQRLSALNAKATKGIKSRLRRTFSFGSAQDLQKASSENKTTPEPSNFRREQTAIESADNDLVVIANQEAKGMGSQIYSHQGQFSVSTDNISISSTASSASLMLRKFGRGMKRSSRNLRNFIRPKSIIGSPGADSVMASSVDLTTAVQAECERVNVNLDPHDKPGGGTGYPRLERNSMEIAPPVAVEAVAGAAEDSRKSIISNDRERAEVLAAVRKGILKRKEARIFKPLLTIPLGGDTSSNSSSPTLAQAEINLPGDSSSPATPSDRRESTEEYFDAPSAPKLTNNAYGSSRSLPNSIPRNISFNSRVQFFDVWSPSEYDRRGDIATCNRLTPLLAQQIKEELNSFKMVSSFSCLSLYDC